MIALRITGFTEGSNGDGRNNSSRKLGETIASQGYEKNGAPTRVDARNGLKSSNGETESVGGGWRLIVEEAKRSDAQRVERGTGRGWYEALHAFTERLLDATHRFTKRSQRKKFRYNLMAREHENV